MQRARIASRGIASLLLIGSLGSCLGSETRTCADGSVCASALACAPVRGCAAPAAIDACAGRPDLATCALGDLTGGCFDRVCQFVQCGNGRVEAGEACDDDNTLGGDGCSANCASEERCGNGVIDAFTDSRPDEECDDGNALDHDGCQANCRVQRCGDGVVDALSGEVCDDGDTDGVDGVLSDGDRCASNCRSNETCGNGIVDFVAGEACDQGLANAAAPDAPCRPDCTLPRCGDGVADPSRGEECDAGALNSDSEADACRTTCQAPRCGDAVTDAGELCDDGNTALTDACLPACVPATCGDGITNADEECDDANLDVTDACALCQQARCGDGFVHVGVEPCDDGGAAFGGCTDACEAQLSVRVLGLPGGSVDLLPRQAQGRTDVGPVLDSCATACNYDQLAFGTKGLRLRLRHPGGLVVGATWTGCGSVGGVATGGATAGGRSQPECYVTSYPAAVTITFATATVRVTQVGGNGQAQLVARRSRYGGAYLFGGIDGPGSADISVPLEGPAMWGSNHAGVVGTEFDGRVLLVLEHVPASLVGAFNCQDGPRGASPGAALQCYVDPAVTSEVVITY